VDSTSDRTFSDVSGDAGRSLDLTP
jgi:hypothetical protein